MNNDELCLTASEIRVLVVIVTKMAKHDIERRLAAYGAHISELQFGVMRILHHRSCTIKELSGKMLLSPATLVPVVDALERQELATRGHDPSDRRRTPLTLTPKGIELVSGLPFMDSNDALYHSLQQMGNEKSHQLLTLLRELVSAMLKDEGRVKAISTDIRSLMNP